MHGFLLLLLLLHGWLFFVFTLIHTTGDKLINIKQSSPCKSVTDLQDFENNYIAVIKNTAKGENNFIHPCV